MTNTERIQAHNAELRECIELAENLPDAGTAVEVVLQDKTITPTKSEQKIKADDDYTGLNEVTVEPIPSQYITTTDATAEDSEIMSGETAYVNGRKVTGTFSIDSELSEQDGLIEQIRTALAGKAAGGGAGETSIVLQDKTITENGTYSADEGYDGLGQVTVSVASSDEEIDALVGLFDDTTVNFESDRITKLTQYAFAYRNCKSISLPNLKSTATRVFTNCDDMTSLSIPNMTGATNTYMAAYCGALQTADVRQASSVSSYTFYSCANLTKLEFDRASSISTNAFNGCTKLATLILRRGSLVSLGGTSALTGTKIAGTGGYIYVPKTLDDGSDGVATYEAATNWSTYSGKFRAIEDYPEICGG